jgi:hypothetical protein
LAFYAIKSIKRVMKVTDKKIYNVALKVPDELYRMIKIAAALENKENGRHKSVQDIIIERLQIGFIAKPIPDSVSLLGRALEG